MIPKITLINLPIVDSGSIATTIPLGIAYLAAYSRGKGLIVQLIDAFGEKIDQRNHWRDGIYYFGMSFEEITQKVEEDTNFVCLSANFTVQQTLHLDIIKMIRRKLPLVKIIVGGNDATLHPEIYLDNGVDFAILGEGENTLYELVAKFERGEDHTTLDGLAYKDQSEKIIKNPKTKFIENMDEIPFPARDLLPLDNYWKRKFSHGPINDRYTPIASSRGCPLNCSYCSSIVFWQRKWRARSPKNFVDEIEECVTKYGITEFEIEDDVFSLNMQRVVDICNEIIKRGLGKKIKWSTPNGIRPEKMNREVLTLFKEAGCKYIIFAPESGSQRLLKEVYNKHIDLDLIAELVNICSDLGIRTGSFIIIGLPVQTDDDYALTKRYIKKLARNGLDEVAVFPVWPYPNTPITKKYFPNYSEKLEDQPRGEGLISSLPSWYPNGKYVAKRQKEMYMAFYKTKVLSHPFKSLNVLKNILSLRQETKTERTLVTLISKFLGKPRTASQSDRAI